MYSASKLKTINSNIYCKIGVILCYYINNKLRDTIIK